MHLSFLTYFPEKLQGNRPARANVCTSSTLRAYVRVNRITFAFGNCSHRAFVFACTASDTFFANFVSHSSYFIYWIFVPITNSLQKYNFFCTCTNLFEYFFTNDVFICKIQPIEIVPVTIAHLFFNVLVGGVQCPALASRAACTPFRLITTFLVPFAVTFNGRLYFVYCRRILSAPCAVPFARIFAGRPR